MVDKNGADKNGADKNGDKLYAQWTPRASGLDAPADTGARRIAAMGWHPDIPDFRDEDLDSKDSGPKKPVRLADLLCSGRLPEDIDLRANCSPIEDQGRLGSCTAQAVVGLMEYMMRRSELEHIDGSRLFVYKVTRKLLGWNGDTGAYLRTAMHAVRAFGVPPEDYWPYDIDRYEEEPTPFLYSFAQNFKAMRYVRLDKTGIGPDRVLENVKSVIARGYGVVFGFTVYSSLSGDADIPFPSGTDTRSGGHAVMAVGYDDNHEVETADGAQNVPSLIIRNSWGTSWGESGYGYLPYAYVERGLARDFWSSYSWDWIDSGQFN